MWKQNLQTTVITFIDVPNKRSCNRMKFKKFLFESFHMFFSCFWALKSTGRPNFFSQHEVRLFSDTTVAHPSIWLLGFSARILQDSWKQNIRILPGSCKIMQDYLGKSENNNKKTKRMTRHTGSNVSWTGAKGFSFVFYPLETYFLSYSLM